MKVLITGGAGFIGSALARAYLETGAHVAVVDSLVSGRRDRVPPEADFFECDIRDPAFEAIVAAERFDVVNHHAALKAVRRALVDPVPDADANILGTLNVLRCAADHGVRRVILASSCAVYGDPDEFPTPETAPLRPLSPYAISKTAGEHYATYFARSRGLQCVAFRYGTAYGPGMLAGSEEGVFVSFITAMLRGEQPRIFGDGEQTRDFVHVDDVVRANLLATLAGAEGRGLGAGDPPDAGTQGHRDAATAPEPSVPASLRPCVPASPFLAYNVAPGRPVTINALYGLLQVLTGYEGSAAHAPAKPGEVYRNWLSSAKAQRELGWRATVQLEEGLAGVVDAARRASREPAGVLGR